MKKVSMVLFVLMLAFSVVLSACGGGDKATDDPIDVGNNDVSTPSDDPVQEGPKVNTDLSGEVTIWSWFDNAIQPLLPGFNAIYPNITINSIPMDWGDVHEKGKTALMSGTGAPDILMIEGSRMREFNTIDGLDDLLQPPYNAGRYKADFPVANWERYLSLDGKRLISFPWDMPPGVTMYRPDVLEEAGFPSEPEELAEYMQDPENFFNMAQTLKAKDQYLMEWNDQVMFIFTMQAPFFDRDLNYMRNTDYYVRALDLAKRGAQLQLGAGVSLWGDDGKQAMNAGKLAMIYSGAWIADCCMKEPLAETSGKWRFTSLPFGVNAAYGGSSFSIPAQSKNKELAWAFVEYALATVEGQEEHIKINTMPGFMPAWSSPLFEEVEDEFLGGQKVNILLRELVQKIPPIVSTPLDSIAEPIWNEGIAEAIEKNLDSKAVLQKIADDIEAAVANDKQKLLDTRN